MEAAARGISASNLTVLNGTDGVNQVVAGVVGQGLTIYETLRKSLATASTQHDGLGALALPGADSERDGPVARDGVRAGGEAGAPGVD